MNDAAMKYDLVVGLEIHVQMNTLSKAFCAERNAFGAAPNTQVGVVSLAYPGSLPVPNQKHMEKAIRLGLALDSTIAPAVYFDRKNYFYPDLPKGYQITQDAMPICKGGFLYLANAGRKVRIHHVHMEEDAGKLIHDQDPDDTLIDLNRAGVSLLEIVTEPDLHSSDEVDAYLKALREVLVYLGVCDGNMEQGSFRCEPNVSIRPVGQSYLGTKVELKNINSFRYAKEAIEFEVRRQQEVLDEGGTLRQETRLWDVQRGQTAVMRSKEEAHDYRYFPDPDLLPVQLDEEWIKELSSKLPELPGEKFQRFLDEYGLPEYDAKILTESKELAEYFEACVQLYPQSKIVSNWVMGELLRELNQQGIRASASPVSPERLVELLQLVETGTVSLKVARELFPELYLSGKNPEDLVKEKGLLQLSDEGQLEALIETVLASHPSQVEQYRNGKETVLGYIVGQVMKASGGKANPGKVNTLLKNKLSA